MVELRSPLARLALVLAALHAGSSRALPSEGPSDTRTRRIRSFANQWRGTPYRWGGTTRSGVDCSGYLRQMYRELFRVELPRTTKDQIRVGRALHLDPTTPARGLNPGDVVFYVDRTGVPNHVVVYVGEGRINHSVSGRGVVTEPIDKLYGRRVVGRRYLIPSSARDRTGGPSLAPPLPSMKPIPHIEVQTLPCPPRFQPHPDEVRRYSRQELPPLAARERTELCHLRLLADALERQQGPSAVTNVARLRAEADWVESIESLQADL